jgi:hypothetical protein
MDANLEEYKRDVLDNKSQFKQNAPFGIDKKNEFDNSVPL